MTDNTPEQSPWLSVMKPSNEGKIYFFDGPDACFYTDDRESGVERVKQISAYPDDWTCTVITPEACS